MPAVGALIIFVIAWTCLTDMRHAYKDHKAKPPIEQKDK